MFFLRLKLVKKLTNNEEKFENYEKKYFNTS